MTYQISLFMIQSSNTHSERFLNFGNLMGASGKDKFAKIVSTIVPFTLPTERQKYLNSLIKLHS